MRAAIIDTETTSLVANHTIKLDKQPHIMEFYGCLYDFESRTLLNELHCIIKPPVKIPPKVVKITGWTDELLADKPPFATFAAEIKAWLEAAPLIIAHNASFDQEMLDIEFERLGQKVVWPPVRCSVEASIHLKGYRLNLTGLHQLLFSVPFAEAHKASADVAALTRCCAELYARGEL